MLQRQISASLRQYATIADLSVRDTATAVSGVVLVCSICWYIGHPVVAVAIALCIFTAESALRLLFKRKGPFVGFSRHNIILTALGLHFINIILYTIPPLVLASDPSLALKITGLLAIVGTQVYVANTWSRVPLFLCAMLGPVIVMLGVIFLQLGQTPTVSSPMVHWAIATLFLFAFIFITVDTLRQQLATERALRASQNDAAVRLAALEEAHRIDTLTGLLNRTAFDAALDVMLDDRQLTKGDITVFLIDLDSFKPINDTYTHEAGDVVLAETANRIRALVGQSGIVGRLGGDEFVCALHDLDGDTEVLAFGTALANTIVRPIHWNARTLKVAASIGASSTSNGGKETVQALCSTADQAMFAAKSAPNRRPILYDPEVFAPRMTAEDKQRLIDSIANKSLRPYYQPKIHLPSGKIIGLEALARWEQDAANTRQPVEFIDQVNEMGLQADFMMSVAGQVVDDINAMLGAGIDPGQVSINVSEVALATHSGTNDLKKIIENNPDASKHLTFEITEDVFIARAADTIQASIATFRALGVRISLDDFGTGFASFHHLRQLDFDELKIDTTFVADLGLDPSAEVLVRGFLNIASGLGVSVVAEGVETKAQERDLINMGCVVAQGFLFSAAVPFQDACRRLEDQQRP